MLKKEKILLCVQVVVFLLVVGAKLNHSSTNMLGAFLREWNDPKYRDK